MVAHKVPMAGHSRVANTHSVNELQYCKTKPLLPYFWYQTTNCLAVIYPDGGGRVRALFPGSLVRERLEMKLEWYTALLQ